MKYTIITFLSLFLWQNQAMGMEQSALSKVKESFPGVHKISDDLYVGKVNDDFYVAMERVDKENIDMWRSYADLQNKTGMRHNLNTIEGTEHFKEVLDQYFGNLKSSNELWIAYASRKPITKKADLKSWENNPDIEMFVTVITSPEALLTSHLGISRTYEAAFDLKNNNPQRKKQADQSIHLHSFAAKVMKMRDPKKVYMMNAPAKVMREILIAKMPQHSVFVGDSIYKKTIEDAKTDVIRLIPPLNWKVRYKGETEEQQEKRLRRMAEAGYKKLEADGKLSLLTSKPPRIMRTKEGRSQQFTIQDLEGKPLFTFDQSSPEYQWIFTTPFADQGIHIPYILIDLDALAEARTLNQESSADLVCPIIETQLITQRPYMRTRKCCSA